MRITKLNLGVQQSRPGRRRWTSFQIASAIFVGVIVLVALLARVLATADPIAQDPPNQFAPPGAPGHPLGTDVFGRDVMARLFIGLQTELFIAVTASVLAALVGITLGLVAGYFGGVVEMVSMRTIDIILGFPSIVLALVIVAIYGPGSATLIVSMAIVFTPSFARLTYGKSLEVRQQEYVAAAEVFGARTWFVLTRVVLPNAIGPAVAQFSLTIAAAILLESGLSFLGLGVVPPKPSLGLMVAEGQRYLLTNPVSLIVPSVAVALVILSFGLFGEALRERFDPKE